MPGNRHRQRDKYSNKKIAVASPPADQHQKLHGQQHEHVREYKFDDDHAALCHLHRQSAA
jgi:hypothetical protein